MKRVSFLVLFNCFIVFGFSQNTSKTENIKLLLEMTGSGKIGVQVIENTVSNFRKSLPDVPEEFWDNILKEVNPDALVKLIIPIYEKYYTEDDIKKVIEFYQSPVGQKMISTMPQLMQESMKAGEIWGKEIGQKVYDDLKKKGYVNEE